MEPIIFLATIPDLQSAITVSGNHEGMRIKLDIPESEMEKALPLMLLRGKVIQVQLIEQPPLSKTRQKRY